jgi:hypothetical protein
MTICVCCGGLSTTSVFCLGCKINHTPEELEEIWKEHCELSVIHNDPFDVEVDDGDLG